MHSIAEKVDRKFSAILLLPEITGIAEKCQTMSSVRDSFTPPLQASTGSAPAGGQ